MKIELKQVLEKGLYFGHKTSLWNPKMKPYIYCQKNGIHIIDLRKIIDILNNQIEPLIVNLVQENKRILFVGTKKQARIAVKQAALKCGQWYLTEKWIGGLLTNFKFISKKCARLEKLEILEQSGKLKEYPKKEAQELRKEKEKLQAVVGGITTMKTLPDLLVVVDVIKEQTAIKEARKLGIPVLALVDTNCNPDLVDYVIPGNDDAVGAIELIVSFIANNWDEASKIMAKKNCDNTQENEVQENIGTVIEQEAVLTNTETSEVQENK